ncbi:hypothetical protein H6G89_21830 [Oscillatoria sp. FACHB-1407]|uniref:hypothetical protein n=1 Tax=Oscillatoria sp. FACHB-1407 TaxID=2692847 RepID=UPI001682C3B6|nr:hypothetical protein [Oscillatoria sp. FACHB-1407]MBD2463645.1 hypothetical protein [Oscillatoria sp. FACHB-1407]
MPSLDVSRRLARQIIDQDIDSLNGLNAVGEYTIARPEGSPANLKATYAAMLEQRQNEVEKLAVYRAAVDAARQAEWEFHNAVLAMKGMVLGQFGPDSDQVQAIGLKKKSNRKRPTRQKAQSA